MKNESTRAFARRATFLFSVGCCIMTWTGVTSAASPEQSTDCAIVAQREEVLLFFAERGLDDWETLGDPSGNVAQARLGPVVATLEGAEGVTQIHLDAVFAATPDDPDHNWLWSAEDLQNAMTWGPDLIRSFGMPDPTLAELDLSMHPRSWPGQWSVDLADRRSVMDVRITTEGLIVKVVVISEPTPGGC